MLDLTVRHASKLVFAASAMALAAPATAQTVQDLQRRIEAQERELQQMRQTLQQIQQNQQRMAAEKAEAEATDLEVRWSPFPTVRSKDGRFEATVRGRVQADYNYIDAEDGDVEETTASELRRARIGVDGKAWSDIAYRLEVDFADNEVDVTDAFVSYRGFEDTRLTVGQFKTPNSLEELTSSRHITFLERAAFTDAFGLNRRLGLGGEYRGGSYGLQAGVFQQNVDSSDEDEGFAAGARGYFSPEFAGGVAHIGGSVLYRDRDNDSDGESLRFRQRPTLHATSNRFVDTGAIDADTDTLVGGELAGVFGRFHVQTEAMYAFVDSTDDASSTSDDPEFWGAYFDIGYFLTDHQRAYGNGAFGRPRFKDGDAIFEGGVGAWQIAGRVDYIDLDDGDIEGGEQLSLVAGLNWWPNRHTRLMFNYVYNDISDSTGAAAGLNDASGDNSVHGVGVRAQVDW